jgi:hypothetical protein
MAIRRGAAMELPHILLLIDDKEDKLLPALGKRAKAKEACYSGKLMMDSGDISGWWLDSEQDWDELVNGLEELAKKSAKGTQKGEDPFLYAVGDGNHSLATAKAVWDEYKAAHAGEPGIENHPARYALVEVENLYDNGISFEPIHRVLFNTEPADVLKLLSAMKGFSCKLEGRCIIVEPHTTELSTAAVQPLLDKYIAEHKGVSIDYIHGDAEVKRIAGDPSKKAVGIILPPIQKEGLFQTVGKGGPLPRKSFSMGEAPEKRFYLECRKLFA